MIERELDAVAASRAALMQALNGADIGAIERATSALAAAAADLGQHGAAGVSDGAREKLRMIAVDLDSARMRVNYLGDRCRRQVAVMADLRGHAAKHTYSPAG